MSGRHLGLVIAHSKARGAGFTLMMVLADSMNAESGEAWLSIDRQARDARIDRSTVIRLHRQLADLGELQVQPGAGPSGTNLYRLGPSLALPNLAEYDGGRTTPPPPAQPPDVAARNVPSPLQGRITPPEHLWRSHPESSKRPERIGTIRLHQTEEDESFVPRSGRTTPPLSPPDASGHPPADQTLWVQVLAGLQRQLSRGDFDTWVRDSEVASQRLVNGRIVLNIIVGNEYAAKHLVEMGIDRKAAEIAAEITGKSVSVDISRAFP